MKIPVDLFIQGIAERKIYYFSSTQISSTDPHYFICIKRSDDILVMSCCTSQLNTVVRYVESRGFPYSTLVGIDPSDENNPFTRETYVNCNDTFIYSIPEFRSMYNKDSVSFSGEIANDIYDLIIIGIEQSPKVEEEIKEMIRVSPTLQ